MTISTDDRIMYPLALALPYVIATMLCFWLAFGWTRWGMRVWVSLLAIAAIWAYLFELADSLEGGPRATGMNKTLVSLEFLTLTGANLIGCYFLCWLDNRFVDIYNTDENSQQPNAEITITDLLICTVGVAVALALVGHQAFYRPSSDALVYAAERSILIAAISVTILWAIISTTPIWIRLAIFASIGVLSLGLCSQLPEPPRGTLVDSWQALLLCCVAGVFCNATLLGFCGYRLVIPEIPAQMPTPIDETNVES